MNSYSEALDWAKGRGLILNPSIERKTVNGISGLYAINDISNGTRFASIPKSALLKTEINAYPSEASIAARTIHAASKEIVLGRQSNFHPMFGLFDTADYLEETSVQYCTEEERSILKSASPILAAQASTFAEANNMLCNALVEFDDTISRDTYLHVALNYASRAMADQGFVPVLDCFNHNDLVGSGIESDSSSLFLSARKDYKAGDEVFVTYGTLDLYNHAINYNYFDPDGTHYIPIKRFKFPRLQKALLDRLAANSPNSQIIQQPGSQINLIINPNAYLSLKGPSKAFIEILTALSSNEREARGMFRQLLEHLDNQNNIHSLSKKSFKGRIKRFYQLLIREKEIIAANRKWIDDMDL